MNRDDPGTNIVVKMSTKAQLDMIRGPGNPNDMSYDDVIQELMRNKK